MNGEYGKTWELYRQKKNRAWLHFIGWSVMMAIAIYTLPSENKYNFYKQLASCVWLFLLFRIPYSQNSMPCPRRKKLFLNYVRAVSTLQLENVSIADLRNTQKMMIQPKTPLPNAREPVYFRH